MEGSGVAPLFILTSTLGDGSVAQVALGDRGELEVIWEEVARLCERNRMPPPPSVLWRVEGERAEPLWQVRDGCPGSAVAAGSH